MEADDSRILVDIVCRRFLRRDFEAGDIPVDIQPETLKNLYCSKSHSTVQDLITEDEWVLACQRIADWQDVVKDVDQPITQRIFARFVRFPSIERVASSFGEARSSAYRAALETIEDDPALCTVFPFANDKQPWRRFDLDAAVSVVTDILAKHAGDQVSMSAAYEAFVIELRTRRKERVKVAALSSDREKRKALVRSFGIWFPVPKDINIWRSDPRTAPRMLEFEDLVDRASSRMRLVRSYLQHIPRRRLSNRTVKDFDANINRIQSYLRGEIVAQPELKRSRV